MTVLIVEDDRGLAELMQEGVHETGFDVACAYSARDALDWLNAHTPYLIVLDYGLPDLNARELLTEMGAQGLTVPPFIVSTGRGDERLAVEMMKLGARDYIVKDGFFLDRLPEVISRAAREIENELGRRRAEQDREALQAQLNHAQKMESIGRLAGGVAHDFNNMLGVILGHTELAMGQVQAADPIHADLIAIRTAAERSADLTRQLLSFARKQTVAPRMLDVNDVVGGMTKMLQRLIGEDVALKWKPGAEVWPVRVDPSQVNQILANLCVNARDAIAGVGTVTIETAGVTIDETGHLDPAVVAPGDYVVLTVTDTGCGIDADTRSHLFEPFFTTKEPGRGTGLGLATVYGVVKQNHGWITVDSEPGQGSTFRIYLPRHRSTEDAAPEQTPIAAALGGNETILLVEDDEAILALTARMLRQLGYAVLEAGTPSQAIGLAEACAAPIHLLMTDVIMPEMNGRDLVRRLLPVYPSLRRVFMSGYTADVIAHHGVLDDGVHFLQKPFSMKDLDVKVRTALGAEPALTTRS